MLTCARRVRARECLAPKNLNAKASGPLMQTGAVIRNSPVRRAAHLESELYDEFVRPRIDLVDSAGVCLARERTRFTHVSSDRAATKPDYGPRNRP